jgi:hypothetical protein
MLNWKVKCTGRVTAAETTIEQIKKSLINQQKLLTVWLLQRMLRRFVLSSKGAEANKKNNII